MSEQTSRKSGMKSTAKKLQSGSRARFGFDPAPASHKVAGAFGKEVPKEPGQRPSAPPTPPEEEEDERE